ncbi:hypothetical protein MKX03_035394 [Papaver bracteatum]|nr:hypothetical protein MKX03_035394 [Papaver bracteatum]
MASSNNSKKRKKGLISEEDIASVLTRYSAPTILALLQEVAQHPDVKIDWNALVKKTTTGITNAAEYQKLWRHLAYCDRLPETVEKLEEQPLEDDDSDLEHELEAFPPATDETSLEAAAYVKVLLASGLSDDAGGGPATVRAPLTINIPSWQESKSPWDNNPQPCSLKGINITVPVSVKKQSPPTVTMKGINITAPVSVQKQSPPAVTTTDKGLDGTVANAANQPAKRKRKPWTTEEDNELIAAVKKLGERNWANILKADIFKGDRTASQLSQRWGIIRKRLNVKSEPGGGGSGIQYELTEQQLAANRAVSHALSMPLNYSLSAGCGVGLTETATVSGQQIPLQTPKGISSVTEKPLVISVKKEASVVPNPMIQAAAVAAGARIATPSTAKPLLKAAQCKTAFQTSTTTTGKSSMPGVTPPFTPNHSGAPANVHYIRTGLSSTSPTTCSDAVPSVSPPPPAIKGKAPSVSTLTSSSTSCGTVAAIKRMIGVTSVEIGNTLREEKFQSSPEEDEVKNSPAEVVKNSSKESEIKISSNEKEVQNSSTQEKVKPEEIKIDCSADIAKDGKQIHHTSSPDSGMVIGDQTTLNLSKLLNVEAAASDQMQLDNHHMENEKESAKNLPGAAK